MHLAIIVLFLSHKASQIRFEGAAYRRDIGGTALSILVKKKQKVNNNINHSINNENIHNFNNKLNASSALTYAKAGVDIDAGNRVVDGIKPLVASTRRSGCPMDAASKNLAHFGAFFDPRGAGYEDPLLVSGTDGVGTKIKLTGKAVARFFLL